MTRFEQIGRDNAEMAIDQVGSYRDMTDALANYYENVGDTLMEMGIRDGDPGIAEAHDAFMRVVRAHGLTFQA